MIHPTRTNLLDLRQKRRTVKESIDILKARQRALMREFLNTTAPFLKERREMSAMYGRALRGLALSLGREGRESVQSIAAWSEGRFEVSISEESIWGLRYKNVSAVESPLRGPGDRGYDFRHTSPTLEESIDLFEKVTQSVLEIATYESKLKRLGDEIAKTTRRIRVLEQRIEPDLRRSIRRIAQYLEEREREGQHRLRLWQEAG
ncbi:MAG: V-type ATP synthase subunit D [Thermodesulfovibrionales bacterium]